MHQVLFRECQIKEALNRRRLSTSIQSGFVLFIAPIAFVIFIVYPLDTIYDLVILDSYPLKSMRCFSLKSNSVVAVVKVGKPVRDDKLLFD